MTEGEREPGITEMADEVARLAREVPFETLEPAMVGQLRHRLSLWLTGAPEALLIDDMLMRLSYTVHRVAGTLELPGDMPEFRQVMTKTFLLGYVLAKREAGGCRPS